MSTTNSVTSLTDSVANSGSGTSSFGQGINVAQFVQFALAGQQASITALLNRQTGISAQTAEITKISSGLSSLDNAIFALKDPLGVLSSQVATTSNSSVVNAIAASTATRTESTVCVASATALIFVSIWTENFTACTSAHRSSAERHPS